MELGKACSQFPVIKKEEKLATICKSLKKLKIHKTLNILPFALVCKDELAILKLMRPMIETPLKYRSILL